MKCQPTICRCAPTADTMTERARTHRGNQLSNFCLFSFCSFCSSRSTTGYWRGQWSSSVNQPHKQFSLFLLQTFSIYRSPQFAISSLELWMIDLRLAIWLQTHVAHVRVRAEACLRANELQISLAMNSNDMTRCKLRRIDSKKNWIQFVVVARRLGRGAHHRCNEWTIYRKNHFINDNFRDSHRKTVTIYSHCVVVVVDVHPIQGISHSSPVSDEIDDSHTFLVLLDSLNLTSRKFHHNSLRSNRIAMMTNHRPKRLCVCAARY